MPEAGIEPATLDRETVYSRPWFACTTYSGLSGSDLHRTFDLALVGIRTHYNIPMPFFILMFPDLEIIHK